jgi:hypothetical protein
MSVAAWAIGTIAADTSALSAEVGRRVTIDTKDVVDRQPFMTLRRPGIWSSNRGARMVRAADGWVVVNLPREADRELVPAWIGCHVDAEPWRAIVRAARGRSWRMLVADARRLGLPVAGVGEIRTKNPHAPLHRLGAARARRTGEPPKVVDLSSLWAGPLCGAVLAATGMPVTKIESIARPDPIRDAAPAFFERLNGAKTHLSLDFGDPARLGDLMAAADIVITGARPRAFEQLGLTPEVLFARNPGLIWVAISGYGWMGEGRDRVAFGDDAAAAGGLVHRMANGEPRFLGDALADPLTGLAAAAGALKAVLSGGGLLVDAAMASTAAGVAAVQCGASR